MPIKRPENQIWFVFNRLPGGNLTAMHVEDATVKRRIGEDITEVLHTAAEQLAGVKKGKEVAIYVIDPATGEGKLTKNEVIVYEGPGKSDLWRNPRAGNVALDWAVKHGAAPIPRKADQKGDDPKTYEYDKRIIKLEGRMDEQDKKLDRILEAVSTK